MGAFNVVIANAQCPGCRQIVAARVQFKYGDTCQHEYGVGEALRWGGNQIGAPGYARVVLDAEAEGCPTCGYDGDWSLLVYVASDRIVAVEPASGQFDFVNSEATFIVLEA